MQPSHVRLAPPCLQLCLACTSAGSTFEGADLTGAIFEDALIGRWALAGLRGMQAGLGLFVMATSMCSLAGVPS